MSEHDDEQQGMLLDLGGKTLDPYWVDPKEPLLIPANPLHFKAHKLQLLLHRLDKQAAKNPAQFNSKNYIEALNEYTRVIGMINGGKTEDEPVDEGKVASDGSRSKAPAVGGGDAASLDFGVSADNPLSG